MGLKELKLSVNETYDFGDYADQVKNCTDLFEGVYEYGCPGERSIEPFCTLYTTVRTMKCSKKDMNE